MNGDNGNIETDIGSFFDVSLAGIDIFNFAIPVILGDYSDFSINIQQILERIFTDLPFIDRRDYPQFPVGETDIATVTEIEGNELSDLVITERELTIPAEVTPKVMIEPYYATDWFDYWAKIALIEQRIAAGVSPSDLAEIIAPGTADATSIVATEDEKMSFFDDLGDLFIDTARDLLDPPTTTPTFFPDITVPTPTAGVPTAPAAACGNGAGASPVWKKVCGVYKWVYPKRRRRRELLTESDYNALLRIQNLKVNANVTMAISKAISR